MDVEQLQNRVEGKVVAATDAGYETLRRELVWNRLTPPRYPRLVVQAATEQDVVEAVRFARTHGMNVAVRGGGHSWVGFPLRDGSLLIDLGRLKQVAIGREARTAVVQPAVTGRELNRQLAAQGLAFPVGHCPTVSLSGFLLNGGLGWNFNGRRAGRYLPSSRRRAAISCRSSCSGPARKSVTASRTNFSTYLPCMSFSMFTRSPGFLACKVVT